MDKTAHVPDSITANRNHTSTRRCLALRGPAQSKQVGRGGDGNTIICPRCWALSQLLLSERDQAYLPSLISLHLDLWSLLHLPQYIHRDSQTVIYCTPLLTFLNQNRNESSTRCHNFRHRMRDLPSIYYRIILITSYLALVRMVEHGWLDKQKIVTQPPLLVLVWPSFGMTSSLQVCPGKGPISVPLLGSPHHQDRSPRSSLLLLTRLIWTYQF